MESLVSKQASTYFDMVPSSSLRMGHKNECCLSEGSEVVELKVTPNVFSEFNTPSYINGA
jgi:hypothetical protein